MAPAAAWRAVRMTLRPGIRHWVTGPNDSSGAVDESPRVEARPAPAHPGVAVRSTRSAIAPAVLAAVLLTGCGEDDPTSAPASTASGTASEGTASESTPPTTSPPPPPTTPSPGATQPSGPATPGGTAPVPTPGTSIPGELLATHGAEELQREVDEGHQPWRTDMAAVAEAFAHHQLGWTDARARLADPHTAEVTNEADGRIVVLQLRQPAREGDGGIYVVVSGVWVA